MARRLKANRKASDDIGRRTCFAGLGNPGNRCMSRVIFSNLSDGDTCQGAGQNRPENACSKDHRY